MGFFYTLSIHISYLTILLASIFDKKARLWIIGRVGGLRKLKMAPLKESSVIWFHAASLGEFEQGRPLIDAIKKEFSQYKILLTFYSPSGYEVRKNYPDADYIMYLPLDTARNARHFIRTIHVKMAFFIKYEYWNNYLKQLYKSRIPIYLVSGTFRPDQVFFKWYGAWFRKMLGRFEFFFVQNNESLELLHNIGILNATVTGDTRFDRVAGMAESQDKIDVAESFTGGNFCMVAGSTWPPDEDILSQLISDAPENYRFIIAPHEIDEHHIRQLQSLFKEQSILFSKYQENSTDKQVLIIDNMGMLSSLYQYGHIAYVGGGFGKGIHNILEAAANGIPVIFGPNFRKFNEAVEMISAGGAFSINNGIELHQVFKKMIHNDEFRIGSGVIAHNYVKNNTGATHKILNHTLKYSSKGTGSR